MFWVIFRYLAQKDPLGYFRRGNIDPAMAIATDAVDLDQLEKPQVWNINLSETL
jgi:hypothetical protein